MARWNVAILEDHPIVREGLVEAFVKAEDFDVLISTDDPVEISLLKPDLAVLDVSLGGDAPFDGVEVCRRMADRTKCAMFTFHKEEEIGVECYEAGARGFLSKFMVPPEILKACRMIMHGHIVFSESTLNGDNGEKVIKALSTREREIMQMLSRSMTVPMMSEEMRVAEKTVYNTIQRICTKLKVYGGKGELTYVAGKLFPRR